MDREVVLARPVDFAAIDNHFGAFISRLSGGGTANIALAAALTSAATRAGHTCLDLSAWATGSVVESDGVDCQGPDLKAWLAELVASSVVGAGGDATPLVLESNRLYFRRYWEYENDIVNFVVGRSRQVNPDIDREWLAAAVQRLFPAAGEQCDWPRLAALTVLLRSFVVVTGGPGTGKTTTVARIIALLLEQQAGEGKLRIALAAPTGKAVMRLQEAMAGVRRNLDCPQAVKEQMPSRATTLHRLLGYRQDSPFFRHDEQNKLAYDLVIVDEASMVDLPLMAKLMRALEAETRLVLLGDRNQLASVEPGAVLADICGHEAPSFSGDFLDKAATITGVEGLGVGAGSRVDSLIELQVSHRFGVDSGIAKVGRAINRGEWQDALSLLQGDEYPDVGWRDVADGQQLRQALAARFGEQPPGWFGIDDPEQSLQALGASQVLCAVRKGVFGVEQVNGCIEEALASKWGIVPGSRFYPGRPVMVSVNNYDLQLYNGDTGIILGDPGKEGALQTFFPAGGADIRKIPLAMLPEHETAYAMTVHKSQGSEFDEVIVILPDWQSAVLSRELLYTALTRARQRLEIWGSVGMFRAGVKAEISRHGGLWDKLRRS